MAADCAKFGQMKNKLLDLVKIVVIDGTDDLFYVFANLLDLFTGAASCAKNFFIFLYRSGCCLLGLRNLPESPATKGLAFLIANSVLRYPARHGRLNTHSEYNTATLYRTK